jgi:hypothetical protein
VSALAGGLLFAVTNGYATRLAARRLAPSARLSHRLTGTAVLFVGTIIMLAQLLSPFGWSRALPVLLAVLAVAAAVHFSWRPGARQLPPPVLLPGVRVYYGPVRLVRPLSS